MGFDPKALMVECGAEAMMVSAIDAAYKRGYDDALAKLVAFAKAEAPAKMTPDHAKPAVQPDPLIAAVELNMSHLEATENFKKWYMDRQPKARRGLVKETLDIILAEKPGLPITEYEKLATELSPEIAIKSVGNQLRRGEHDGVYRRDRPGGYRWYLASHANGVEPLNLNRVVGSTPAFPTSKEGGDGHGPATT